jgi:isopentenyl phosphate kinase
MIQNIGSDPNLDFLKLGGSLITRKAVPRTPRPDVLARLAGEIAEDRRLHPERRLLLGHGSGSYGHVPARKFGTRQGVRTPEQWQGFAEVWRDANALNRLVVDALRAAGLPVVSFPPSASVTARDGQVIDWNIAPLQAALEAGLLPVIQGDAIFDSVRGGTILSTEELFVYLASRLHPARLLLAGSEPGVWSVYPPRLDRVSAGIVSQITPENFQTVLPALSGSQATDVTGGMASKVLQMLALVQELPGLEVRIFSGQQPGCLQEVLAGGCDGTRISAASTL